MAEPQKRYRVIAPVVTCPTMGDHGRQIKYIQQGGDVPADAPDDWVGYHLRDNMIAEIPSDAPPAAAPLPEPAPPAPAPAPEPEAEVKPVASSSRTRAAAK